MRTHCVSPAAFQRRRGLGSSAAMMGVDVPVEGGLAAPLESFWRFGAWWSGVRDGVLARGEEAAARCMNCDREW